MPTNAAAQHAARRRPRLLACGALVLALVAACATEPDPQPAPASPAPPAPTQEAPTKAPTQEPEPTAPPPPTEPTVHATGLDAPWSITFHGEVPLVSERDTARVLELGEDGSARKVGSIDGVVSPGEAGLLGIAAHEDYLYAYFTASGQNRIERYELAGDPGALELGAPETVLADIPAASFHNGGRIAFGPDGMLYATTGDVNEPGSAQDVGSLAGKILRLRPDGGVPDDNPFPDSLVYSYGHRNVQGIAWDEDGTMYASEFGQDTWDELNVIEAGGNYGWPAVEGMGNGGDFIDPVQQWEPAEASPSGIAAHGDHLYIANLRGARLTEVPLNELGSSSTILDGYGRLRDVVEGPDGALWVLTNNTDGRGQPDEDDDRIIRFAPGS
ncbi:MAG TPA: PQQ-dependent sugar dehydrogenase [Actinomycetaceae bacterium]|nr:PQQ-dependent sugar dehydrogenase [Actinomycetaceae bacterium]